MNTWITVPHGEFFVSVDPALWLTVRRCWALRGMPWFERPSQEGETLPEPITFLDFLIIAATCPCPEHMRALALDFTP